jgi:transposase-like protein
MKTDKEKPKCLICGREYELVKFTKIKNIQTWICQECLIDFQTNIED